MVRVLDAAEAAVAGKAGVDAVEVLMDAGETPDLSAIRAAFGGSLRLRFSGSATEADASAIARTSGADIIAFPAATARTAAVDAIGSVAVIDAGPTMLEIVQGLGGGVDGVMLDAGPGRLVGKTGIAELDAFASACRARGFGLGLAGGLEAPDVARLLLLEPDVMAFDTAVRQGHATGGAIDIRALDAIRELIPRDGGSGRRQAKAIHKVVDRIFVRDFEIGLAIGAYQAEHGARQRVRFSVVADVAREPVPPRDMRDVFSYDVIIETIRVLSERAHVTFVETLAEEVAAALLTQKEVVAVNVKVEKLDVIAGAVGIEIVRRCTGR